MSCALMNRPTGPSAAQRWIVVALAVAVGFALAAVQASPQGAAKVEGTEQMTIRGRVLGPDGMPVANAQVAVVVQQWRRSEKPEGTYFAAGMATRSQPLGSCRTDNAGRFRLTGPRGSPSLPYLSATLYAAAPGYGLVIQPIDQAAPRQTVTVELNPERAIRGRLIDLQGQPAAGVEVRTGDAQVPVWPRPVLSDDKGRFYLRGLGLAYLTLELHHPRFAPQWLLNVEPRPLDETRERTLSLVAPRRLRGRVT